MIIASVDIGYKGAIVLFDIENNNYKLISYFPMPVISKNNKKQDLNISEIYSLFSPASKIIIENVHTFPKDGRVSAFNFGYQKGIIYAIAYLTVGKENTLFVAPRVWKRYFNLLKLPRKEQKQKAINIVNKKFNLNLSSKEDGIADAILIGSYYIENNLVRGVK